MPDKNARLVVILQPNCESLADAIEVAVNIDAITGYAENEPVDFHCNVPPGKGMSPMYQVCERHIDLLRTREGTSKYLSAILTEKIMEVLSMGDRIDGYSKKEWNEMHKPIEEGTKP